MGYFNVFKWQNLIFQVMWIILALILTSSLATYQQNELEDIANTTADNHVVTLEVPHDDDNSTQNVTSEVTYTESNNYTDVPLTVLDQSSSDPLVPSTTDQLEDSNHSWVSDNCTNNDTLDEEYLKDTGSSDSVFNAGIIAGISALVVVIAILLGAVGFMVYRYFRWNHPSVLGHKFSNDESTGYIDDTAFRENSEEMHSLDNDSFLNSLEAVTIQNYWTDQVKHTKL